MNADGNAEIDAFIEETVVADNELCAMADPERAAVTHCSEYGVPPEGKAAVNEEIRPTTRPLKIGEAASAYASTKHVALDGDALEPVSGPAE